MQITQELAWINKDAEANIIACMLTDKESVAYCADYLEPADFYEKKYGEAFKTIKHMWEIGKSVDIVSVAAAGNDISELASLTISILPQSYRNHAKIVKTLSLKRKYAIIAKGMMTNLEHKHFESPEEIVEYINSKLAFYTPKSEQKPQDLITICNEYISNIDSIYSGKINPIMFGMRDIDRITGGLWGAELNIIAAGPATGKTAFALEIAKNAGSAGYHVDFFSLEMNRLQVASRLLSQTGRIKADVLRIPKSMKEEDWKAMCEATSIVSRLPITVDQTSRTIQEIKNKCERKREQGKLDLVIIDYLQLLTSSARHESRRQEIEYISRELKLISRDLNIPVIALSQLNREGQKNLRPRLYDLRESGSLEQDADNVIFLYNPRPDESLNADLVDLEIIIAKQRSGKTGKIDMRFDKRYLKFFGLER